MLCRRICQYVGKPPPSEKLRIACRYPPKGNTDKWVPSKRPRFPAKWVSDILPQVPDKSVPDKCRTEMTTQALVVPETSPHCNEKSQQKAEGRAKDWDFLRGRSTGQGRQLARDTAQSHSPVVNRNDQWQQPVLHVDDMRRSQGDQWPFTGAKQT